MCKGVCIPKTSKQLHCLGHKLFVATRKLSQYPQEGLWTVNVEEFGLNFAFIIFNIC